MKKIAIIDYQVSNLFSVKHACECVGMDAIITSDPKNILSADAAILPGVGAFGTAMENLNRLSLVKPIKDFIESDRTFMGICLGMQLLFSESQEFGLHKGLDVINGRVMKFQNGKVKIPQIGWNQIYSKKNKSWLSSPLRCIKNNEFMYFVHSYYVDPADKNIILSFTNYENIEYCSSVLYNNVFAVQFHPEKSGPAGVKIYRDWSLGIKSKE